MFSGLIVFVCFCFGGGGGGGHVKSKLAPKKMDPFLFLLFNTPAPLKQLVNNKLKMSGTHDA